MKQPSKNSAPFEPESPLSTSNSTASARDGVRLELADGLFPKRYAVEALIREGAHSIVYRGADRQPAGAAAQNGHDAAVVLKCFDNDKHSVYLRELAAGFGIAHRQLIRCLDTFCLSDGRGCIVYDYIDGGTLQQQLARRVGDDGRFNDDRLISFLRDMLQALRYLHDAGCIHCDIKPENVFVRASGGYILGDLGAVCFIREAQRGQYAIGTPAYMAPERFYDRFEFNSDLYSLGVVAFELATGERPFMGSAAEVTRAHLSRQPAFENIASARLRDFIERLLEKDPQQRLPNAAAALRILDHLCQQSAALSDASPPEEAKIIRLSERQQRGSSHQALDLPAADAALGQGRLRLQTTLPLTTPTPRNLMLANVDGRPRLGLLFDSHAEFIDPFGEQPNRIVLHSGPLQFWGDNGVAYSSAGRVLSVDLKTGRRHTFREGCRGLIGFYLTKNRLLWSSSRGWHFVDLATGIENTVRHTHYIKPPAGCLLNNGCSLTGEGATGQRLSLRDVDNRLMAQWELDGPVLALTPAADPSLNAALALTLNAGSHGYSLWWLAARDGGGPAPDDCKPLKFDLLLNDIAQWHCAPGYIIWLDAKRVLHSCGIDGRPQTASALLAQEPAAVTVSTRPVPFAVTPNHRFVATLERDGDSNAHSLFAIWQNLAVT